MTCYLCALDDPTADEEACADCDTRFWSDPCYIVLPDPADLPPGDS